MCSIVFQKSKLAGSLPQLTSAGVVRKSEQNKFLISENRNFTSAVLQSNEISACVDRLGCDGAVLKSACTGG
jgi:hypothetical protein